MAKIKTIFWDVGGVLLTNGWDRDARRVAADKFGLDWDDFQERHELIGPAFETGQVMLDEYLTRTIFYRSRSFTRDEFKEAIFSQSRAHRETLAIAEKLAQSDHYLMAMLNNEGLEINLYRIEKFNLQDYFDIFLSSCFLKVRKPGEAIYRTALQITQTDPKECLFIDDRKLNLECAQTLGIQTIHYQTPSQLQEALHQSNVQP